jgi:hypothetical protein
MSSNNSGSVAAALNHGNASNQQSSNSSGPPTSQILPASSNYTQSKLSAKAKEAAEKMQMERKKAVHVMVYQFLYESGFLTAAKEFANNVGFNISKVAPADNVDLETILVEYEEYYTFKFGRKPKFFRKSDGTDNMKSMGGELEMKKPQA